MWVLGKTRAGKSTLLTNLIYEDMQAGRGLMVIDPPGDLVEALLDLVPPHRVAACCVSSARSRDDFELSKYAHS
jgi:hypothetical protein